MELLKNSVDAESIPHPTKKERLGCEVASRVMWLMGRNDPDNLVKVNIKAECTERGERVVRSKYVYVSEGPVGSPHLFKSGSKVIEAVIAFLERLHNIESVSIEIYPGCSIGTFTYAKTEA